MFLTVLLKSIFRMNYDKISLAEIYDKSILEEQKARYKAIHDKFVATYKVEPSFYVRAPGRVNLIGEHIDYHGYGVLPIAIANDFVIAVYTNNKKAKEVHVANMEEKFEKGSFTSDGSAKMMEEHTWYKYVQCGYKGVYDHTNFTPKTIKMLFDGKVPVAAGLSSSSSLVVASALAFSKCYNITLTRKELGELCRVAEFYIGTMGGGMDQSISCFGLTNCAIHITFFPLDGKIIKLPEGVAWVVANSYVSSEKAVAAAQQFNKRVVEGIFGAKILGKHLKLENWKNLQKLKDVQEQSKKSFAEMIELCKEVLHDKPYTTEELQEIFDVKELKQEDLIPSRPAAKKVFEENKEYIIRQRCLHVYSEAKRVYDFIDICNKEKYDDQIKDLGMILDESHRSCNEDYECSCKELNDLVKQEKSLGAIGARLTGAGWGGCTISMINEKDTEKYLKDMKEGDYYKNNKVTEEQIKEGLFATKPCLGAALVSKDAVKKE